MGLEDLDRADILAAIEDYYTTAEIGEDEITVRQYARDKKIERRTAYERLENLVLRGVMKSRTVRSPDNGRPCKAYKLKEQL